MATQQFESAEDINRHFDRRIKDADDPLDQANLRAEKAETIAAFRERQSNEATMKALIAQAATEFKIESDYVDLIRGNTPEEIRASAEKLAKLATPPAPSSEDLYGGSATGGGQQTQRSKDPGGDQLTDFEQKFNNNEVMPPQAYQRYVRERLGRAAYTAMQEHGRPHVWKNNQELKDRPEWERL